MKISICTIKLFSTLVLIAFFGITGCAHTGKSSAPVLHEDSSNNEQDRTVENNPGLQEDEIVEEEITDDELFKRKLPMMSCLCWKMKKILI